MLIVQTTSRFDGIKPIHIRLAISDVYEELFNYTPDSYTNVVNLPSLKEDSNLSNGSFAVDQAELSISADSIDNADDYNALWFLIGASDIRQQRFCAIFINPTFTDGKADLNTLKFSGRISDKIKGDDILWGGQQWETDIHVIRSWKFSAVSFDVSLFERISLNTSIQLPDETVIDGLFARISDAEWNGVFSDKFFYEARNQLGVIVPAFAPDLGNLYDILRLLLDKAEAAIADIIGTPDFTIDLAETDALFQGSPAQYVVTQNASLNALCLNLIGASSAKVDVVIRPTEADDTESSVYLHKRLFVPATASEQSFSFRSLDNLAQILFEIARALGCYLKMRYVTATQVEVKFLPRSQVAAQIATYVLDVTSGSRDTSLRQDGGTTFIGRSSPYAKDHFDQFQIDLGTYTADGFTKEEITASPSVLEVPKPGSETAASRRLLLTSSATVTEIEYTAKNIWGGTATVRERYPQNLSADDIPLSEAPEILHTAIYLRTPTTPVQVGGTSSGEHPYCWRPLTRVYTRLNGNDVQYDSLVLYINALNGFDRLYYQNEYQIDVPSLSGFKKAEDDPATPWDDTEPDWRNIALGALVPLQESITNWDGTEFATTDKIFEWVVVGIESNLDAASVKIKLHDSTRFAYTQHAGEAESSGIAAPSYTDEPIAQVGNIVFTAASAIPQGAAVSLIVSGDDAGKVEPSTASEEHYARVIGIAAGAAAVNDSVTIIRNGLLQNPAFTAPDFPIGSSLWLWTPASGELNVRGTHIGDDDVDFGVVLVQRLGTVVGDGVIDVSIHSPEIII